MNGRTRYEKPVVVAALAAVAKEWKFAGDQRRDSDARRAQARRAYKSVAEGYYAGESNGWARSEARLSDLYDVLDELFGHPVTNANDR